MGTGPFQPWFVGWLNPQLIGCSRVPSGPPIADGSIIDWQGNLINGEWDACMSSSDTYQLRVRVGWRHCQRVYAEDSEVVVA